MKILYQDWDDTNWMGHPRWKTKEVEDYEQVSRRLHAQAMCKHGTDLIVMSCGLCASSYSCGAGRHNTLEEAVRCGNHNS